MNFCSSTNQSQKRKEIFHSASFRFRGREKFSFPSPFLSAETKKFPFPFHFFPRKQKNFLSFSISFREIHTFCLWLAISNVFFFSSFNLAFRMQKHVKVIGFDSTSCTFNAIITFRVYYFGRYYTL